VDIRGETFDPTSGDHLVTAITISKARKFVGYRFPDLKNAYYQKAGFALMKIRKMEIFFFDLVPQITRLCSAEVRGMD